MNTTVPEHLDAQQLDALTSGAFSAPTSGERSALLRDFLNTDPALELIQAVYKEMSVKDKGAAKLLREKLDDIRRTRAQEQMASDWAVKAQALLDAPRLNLADAMAWQREAAKAGAPLGREPLASLKTTLSDRIKAIEDVQHHIQVQKEVAVLLAQRIEVLSTKPWQEAKAASETLAADVLAWDQQAHALRADPQWPNVDPRFTPQLDNASAQMKLVWEAFSEALAQTAAAAADPKLPLPAVPVWADALREQRLAAGLAPGLEAGAPRAESAKSAVDPQVQAQAIAAVQEALTRLEQEMAQGHGKASVSAAASLRQALKDHGRYIKGALDQQVQAALAAAGELEGWQRWRADQLRQELVTQAEGLLKRPEGQALGGRKMQESLRHLREQWKTVDQGGVPNHNLWKRFDEACNLAYKVVEAWLEKIKAEAAEHKAQREALMAELEAWAQQHPGGPQTDWKQFNRDLHQFADRWRDAGHLSEKAFAELQPRWKNQMAQAAAPLEALQHASLERRQNMIAEAQALGEAPALRIDAVKSLQQRWQAEAHTVPMDRRQEQKLWDAFRKPIDEAFNRKTAEREKAAAELSAHDQAVVTAAQALQAASKSGNANAIKLAVNQLEAVMRGEVAAPTSEVVSAELAPTEQAQPSASPVTEAASSETEAASSEPSSPEVPAQPPSEPAPPKSAPAKPVVAVRGDDRPGMKKAEPEAPRGRPGDRHAQGRDTRDTRDSRDARGSKRPERAYESGRPTVALPRLGDAAFRAQRDALDQAQAALRQLAALAHGESLTQMLRAWEQRSAEQMPSVQELGSRVSPSVRTLWLQAIAAEPKLSAGSADLNTAMLRLEMASEVPTPASDLDARRALQLQLLTRRNDPSPIQTWGQDAARMLSGPWDEALARRLQAALKVLLRK